MLIQYYLADGQEINYQTVNDLPNLEEVNQVALMYAQLRQNVLPEWIFVSVRIYNNWVSSMGYAHGIYASADPTIQFMHTSVGTLKIRILPWASDAKLFLIGRADDYERYDLDRIFEEVVLKDCERV